LQNRTLNILVIDLTSQQVKTFEWDIPRVANGFLGSVLLDYFHRLDGTPPVILAGSALSGYQSIGSAVAYIVSQSPQSGGIVEAKVEGRLASAIRSNSLAAIVLRNAAKNLSGVCIEGDSIRFIDATLLSGTSVKDLNQNLTGEFPLEQYVIGAIGNAGELTMAHSSIVFDLGFPTPTGGLGAMLGSKNLKYVAIATGKGQINFDLDEITSNYKDRIPGNPLTMSEYNPPGMGIWPIDKNLFGYLGAENFSKVVSNSVLNFDNSNFYAGNADSENLCLGCPQSCIKMVSTTEKFSNLNRLHQKAMPLWISQLGISSSASALYFNEKCHEFGLEQLSVGAMLGYLAEVGNVLKFGDEVIATKLLDSWCSNPKSFPGGTGSLSSAMDGSNDEKMMHVKNMPLPPWDARGAQGLGLIMAINPGGPRYDVVEHDIDFDPDYRSDIGIPHHLKMAEKYQCPPQGFRTASLNHEKVKFFARIWQLWSAMDALGICTYAGPPTRELTEEDISKMFEVVSGELLSVSELLEIGKMRITAHLKYNIQQKIDESLNCLPSRFTSVAIADGKLRGNFIDPLEFAEAKKTIYREFNWDANGELKPNTPETQKLSEIQNIINEKWENND
jgi:aldehyde:ferredoxin oxidoreductase